MRVFLDANILFSAAQSNTQMGKFVELLLDQAECLTNNYAMEEARRNLAAKFPEAVAPLARLAGKCEIVAQMEAVLEIELPSKDMPILGGAIAGRATHLLTGDRRDFGKFWGQTVQGVLIVSPRMLADVLQLS
jgi:predicted nucleic acid-binding protein